MAPMSRPRDNRAALVAVTAAGRVSAPSVYPEAVRVDREGRAFLLPGTGGVHPGVHVGDPAARLLGDHLMVGASIVDANAAAAEPGALHLLTCVGNRVRTADGEFLGVVAGKRGGLAPGFLPPCLVAVEAPRDRLDRLVPGAGVVVEAIGRGFALPDWPDVLLMNLAPNVLDALPIREHHGRLEVSVRTVVPSRAAGAGLGQDAWIGDVEIMDLALLLPSRADLAFGDLVAFDAIDARYGRYWRPGTVSVGIVSHGPSPAPGHGIGVTMLVAGSVEQFGAVVDDSATLAPVLRRLAGSEPGPRRRAAAGNRRASSPGART